MRDSDVPRFSALWRYLPADGRILNAGVRYLRDELGQVDTSWRWPVAPRWTWLGRINYSFLNSASIRSPGHPRCRTVASSKAVLGFEYNADCWARASWCSVSAPRTGSTTTAFFVQLELSGLGPDRFRPV